MDDQPRRAADDTARDMERRLEDLGHEVHDAEKARAAVEGDRRLMRVAGDATETREGEHSRGGTLDAEHHAHTHRPREAPHEQGLSREQLDTEQALAEEADEMQARLGDLDEEIGEADRAARRVE